MFREKDENGNPKDWCTAFPDRVAGINLTNVCKEHDIRYNTQDKSRWTADLELFNDALEQGNSQVLQLWFKGGTWNKIKAGGVQVFAPILATGMWTAIRLVGWAFYKTDK